MKSAYEKAMERFGADSSAVRPLTDKQKARITELNNLYQAKIAERETFLRSRIQTARAQGDLNECAELEEQLRRDLAALREEWETKKQKVRDEK